MLVTCERRTVIGDRDRAVLRFLLDLSCRRSEMLALDVSDVEMRTGAVRIRQRKGSMAAAFGGYLASRWLV